MENRLNEVKRFINYILLNPDSIGLSLDKGGYISLYSLEKKCKENDYNIFMDDIKTIGESNYFKLVNKDQFIKAKKVFEKNKNIDISIFDELKND